MKEGWIYLNNEKVFLQRLPAGKGKVWYTFSEDNGLKVLNRWDLVRSIIDDLQGTCKSLTEACENHNLDFDELDFDELDELDQNIFCCDSCGWWYEISEEAEAEYGQFCENCFKYDVEMENDQ
jgi:hypothetical protein